MFADPLFVAAEANDFRLRAASPCVDGANPAYGFVPSASDGAGRPRVEGGAPDLGAYEGAWSGAVVKIQTVGAGFVVPSGAVVMATSTSTQSFDAVALNESRPFLQFRLNGTPIGSDPVVTLSGVTKDSVLEAVFEQKAWYADASRPDDSGDGASWATAKKTLQEAVNLALDGDTVWVADGTYSAGGAVTPGGLLPSRLVVLRDIAIRGTNDAVGAVISGGSTARGPAAVRCAYMERGSLECLRLDRGATLAGTNPVVDVHGAGLYVPEGGRVRLSQVIVSRCLAQNGAGVYADGAWLEGTDCVLTGNTASAIAGGAYGGRWHRSEISKNRADTAGGGAYNAWLVSCNLEGNYLTHNSGSCGGGLYAGVAFRSRFFTNSVAYSAAGSGYADLFECEVISNVVRRADNLSVGGGVIGGYLSHCRIFGNRASASPAAHGAVLRNCLIDRNVATGPGGSTTYYAGLDGCTLVSCVVVSNTGARYGGLQGGSATNSIILDNRIYTNLEAEVNTSGATLRYCATWPHPGGIGNIEVTNVRTLFRNYEAMDYRLAPGSPCEEAGENASAPWMYDLEGNSRLLGSAVDIGVYERVPSRRGTLFLVR